LKKSPSGGGGGGERLAMLSPQRPCVFYIQSSVSFVLIDDDGAAEGAAQGIFGLV
jgi:hypothetical protein